MSSLAIDVGGTKTHIGLFDEGKLSKDVRFSTPQSYKDFLISLKTSLDELSRDMFISAACVGLPGVVDREQGRFLVPTNLPNWLNAPLGSDITQILGIRTVFIENDANLAALAEAKHLDAQTYRRAAYLTISTGIGIGVIVDGRLAPDLLDAEVGELIVPYEGEYVYWEDIASGTALSKAYGQPLEELPDSDHQWQDAGEKIGIGVAACAALYNELDAIIFGGGVGQRFECFKDALQSFIITYTRGVKTPVLFSPSMPSDASLYGAYYHLKNQLNT